MPWEPVQYVSVCVYSVVVSYWSVFFKLTFVRLFTVTFKSLPVHFGLFPASFLSKPVAICRFSEELYCNYTSVRSGIHALSYTPLPISLLGFCVLQILQYEQNFIYRPWKTPSIQCCLAVESSLNPAPAV